MRSHSSKRQLMDLIITGGTVVGETEALRADVGVLNGRIAKLGDLRDHPASKYIDARGLLVLPGGIDVHVHLSLPFGGTVSSDDFSSGSQAAAMGGTTTMFDFVSPSADTLLADSIQAHIALGDRESMIDYALHMIINDVSDETLAQLPDVLGLGITSLKAFTAYPDEGLMLQSSELTRLMQRAAALGAQVDVHAEDGERIEAIRQEYLSAGWSSMDYHPKSRPPATEVDAIRSVLAIAEKTRCATHIHHLSTAEGLDLIRSARNPNVSAETCMQYVLFDDTVYDSEHALLYAISPPLRRPRHAKALWSGLEDETVSILATDHCPFTLEQKQGGALGFLDVPNGMPGVETRLPLLYSEAVAKRKWPLPLFVRLVATNPAKRFGLYPKKGVIMPGSDADIVLFDPKARQQLNHDQLHMNCDWSPYENLVVSGWPRMTFVRGQLVCSEGEINSPLQRGRFVFRSSNLGGNES